MTFFHRNRHFLQKKEKRLRQAASRGKWSFSWRNAIWAKKKAPAASCQPRKMVLFLKIGVPTKIQTKIKEKGGGTHDLAILRSESHENCFVRINFSRRIILKPLKKYLVTKKETLTFYEKSPLFLPKKTAKKHQNRHEMVIHGSKSDVDPTKMIRKTRSTIL